MRARRTRRESRARNAVTSRRRRLARRQIETDQDIQAADMKIISVVQQKGGVGKTTIAVNISGEFSQMGARVNLFDADAQQSAVAWALPGRLPFPVHPTPFSAAFPIAWAKTIVERDGDIAVIDTSPGLGPLMSACVELSDLMLLPCGPSSIELFALRETIEALNDIKRRIGRHAPRILIVPARVDSSTDEGRQLKDELLSFGGEIGTALPFDMSFVRAFASGETVATYAKDSPADLGMKALGDEIVRSFSWN